MDDGAKYYAQRASLDVALRFLRAVQVAYEFICENPHAAPHGKFRSPLLEGVRRWRVPGFENHLVFCRVDADGVEILRVLHGARDIDALFDSQAP
ncbi:MAG: type II toxin-antitoxin system RelE/ParE family toxin [Planctomycetes bacterium]|nr:type II toxin-antitoxin system RelE/ParE family toxin [Planctomycetota bacterium]